MMEWRLIEDGPASGAWNMAVDEALLLELSEGTASPVLRFYQWEPACLSLGRFQRLDEGHWDVLQRIGSDPKCPLDVVRRPTGGRAVLHQHEVTYCAVFPESILPDDSRSVLGAYHWLSRGLLEGLRTLGILASFGPSDAEPTGSGRGRTIGSRDRGGRRFDCFGEVAHCDFTIEGRKLLGAAQYRYRGCALQHGSLLLEIDRDRWNDLDLTRDAVSLADIGVAGERQAVLEALKIGLARRLGVVLLPASLSAREREVAQSLLEMKYACELWNRRGKMNDT